MAFTKNITTELQKKLDPAHVKPAPQGKYGDYIEGWHAIAEANRIFGFDGWSYDVKSLVLTNAGEFEIKKKGRNGDWTEQQVRVGYMATVMVTVDGITRTDTGHGQGFAKPQAEGDAHDSAIKEAVTDALKRALRTFGNPFGLALYDKSKANVGTPEADKKSNPDKKDNSAELKAEWIKKRTDSGPFLQGRDAKEMFELLRVAIDNAENIDDLSCWKEAHQEEIATLPDGLWADIIWLGGVKFNSFKDRKHG